MNEVRSMYWQAADDVVVMCGGDLQRALDWLNGAIEYYTDIRPNSSEKLYWMLTKKAALGCL